jgi:hypothetical protein
MMDVAVTGMAVLLLLPPLTATTPAATAAVRIPLNAMMQGDSDDAESDDGVCRAWTWAWTWAWAWAWTWAWTWTWTWTCAEFAWAWTWARSWAWAWAMGYCAGARRGSGARDADTPPPSAPARRMLHAA